MNPQELRIGNIVGFTTGKDIRLPIYDFPKKVYSVGHFNAILYDYQKNATQCFLDESDEFHYNELVGIPITEEWLNKLGFEDWGIKELNEFDKDHQFVLFNVIEGSASFFVNLNISNYGGQIHKCWKIMIDSDVIYFKEVKFIHQLQNIFPLFSGYELEIKPN